jgi:hypothetical protein
MRNLTLDINSLAVESFSADGSVAAAHEPEPNALAPTAWTYGACCYKAGVAACTVVEPCCVATP